MFFGLTHVQLRILSGYAKGLVSETGIFVFSRIFMIDICRARSTLHPFLSYSL